MTHDTGMLQPPSLPVTQPAFPACACPMSMACNLCVADAVEGSAM